MSEQQTITPAAPIFTERDRAQMSAEWWEAEARRARELHIAAHQQLLHAETAARDLEAVRAILKAQDLADGTARRAALLILAGHPRKASPT